MPAITPIPPSLPTAPRHIGGARKRWRWLGLLAVSLLLHGVLLQVAGGGGAAAPKPATAVPVIVAMLSAPSPPAPIAAPTPAVTAAPTATTPARPLRPKPKRPRRTAPRLAPAPASAPTDIATPPAAITAAPPEAVVDSAPSPGATTSAATNSASVGAGADTNAAQVAEDTAASANPATTATSGSATENTVTASGSKANTAAVATPTGSAAAPPYRISLPPNVTLNFEVRYATRGTVTRGSSVINWRHDQSAYAINGEITKFGFALSSFHSEGAVGSGGIAPALYTEKNARRSETTTRFLHDDEQKIRFSASPDTYAMVPGAQDRSSILWQLAGIGRGDSSVLVPGTVLDVYVAGVRDAEHWFIEVIGEETVALEHGPARVWHLLRAPRPGSYDKRLDIWLAPEQQWYPVKLRYTEKSGDTLELSLSELQ